MEQQRTERFEMRLDLDTLRRLDDWRADQTDLPSRAAAIRRLVESGLSMDKQRFRPSSGERLIIAMLCELCQHLYQRLDVKPGIDLTLVEDAVAGGHHWALEWAYELFEGPVDRKVPREVADILEMWWTIEWSYDQLSEEEQGSLETDAGITREDAEFRGFDGNEETSHYSVAGVMINGLGRFRHFKERDLNSHWPYLQRYRSMLALYQPMKQSLKVGKHLTSEQITKLVKVA